MQPSFIPNEENANKIETWNQTGGHTPFECHTKKTGTPGVRNSIFYLSSCAVNCYIQWFSGLSCSAWNISSMQQYKVAKERVLRYNMVVVIEKLRDPKYAKSIERFFGVRGITQRGTPWCEKESHAANKKVPLVVQNDTRESLTHLNELDVQLYHELSDCLDEDDGRYDFPKWNPNRFALNSFNVTKELELYIHCVNETGKEGACKRKHIFALKHPHNY